MTDVEQQWAYYGAKPEPPRTWWRFQDDAAHELAGRSLARWPENTPAYNRGELYDTDDFDAQFSQQLLDAGLLVSCEGVGDAVGAYIATYGDVVALAPGVTREHAYGVAQAMLLEAGWFG